jgi:hypothetical protein
VLAIDRARVKCDESQKSLASFRHLQATAIEDNIWPAEKQDGGTFSQLGAGRE